MDVLREGNKLRGKYVNENIDRLLNRGVAIPLADEEVQLHDLHLPSTTESKLSLGQTVTRTPPFATFSYILF